MPYTAIIRTMNTLTICLAAATLGVNFGWQRSPEGGMEYIIQLDPQSLEALRSGQPVQSDIHPGAGDVRSFRIIMGTGAEKLQRDTPPEKPKPKPSEPTRPGMATTLPLFGLFASLGANVFLAWVAMGWRRRCRAKMADG
jgi:hypothetical protein